MQIGINSHIATTAFIKQKDSFVMGKNSDILDYSLISPQTTLGDFCLIDRFCLIAGSQYNFMMGNFSGLAGHVTIWCQSNDYVNNLISHRSQIVGDVIFGQYTGVGASSTIMPNNIIPEGTVIGANSFVPPKFSFKPWSVYAGNPIRFIKPRNQKSVMIEVEKSYQ